jgi:hypothetical protein
MPSISPGRLFGSDWFVWATVTHLQIGGGPGAMEASNLGAYLADKSNEQTELALKIIAEGSSCS